MRLLFVLLILLAAACTPAASGLTPIAASNPGTPTRIAADGPPPTATLPPAGTSASPTATVTASPTATPPVTRTLPSAGSLTGTPPTAIPSPLPALLDVPGTTVFLLLGADSATLNNVARTDAILLLAVYADGGAALLSLPRDLYVYIPTVGMDRINTAYVHGERADYPGGGIALLRDTVAYNLGIHAPLYARVDFSGFATLIDALGGVEIPVPCPLQDWALRPGGDPENADDWAMLTLPAGVQHMDGRLALWYVRSRRTSTDLDRGRRQQDVLRAVGQRARAQDWLAVLPGLWDMLTGYVDTNLTLDRAVALVPLAVTLNPVRVRRYVLRRDAHYTSWTTPGGASVLLPQGEALAALAADFLTPPTANQLVTGQPRILILNHSGQPDMARVAAARLAWDGLAASYDDSGGGAERPETVIIDLTGQEKGGLLAGLQTALGLADERVLLRPTADRDGIDYRVELGRDYDACQYPILPPQ